MMNFWTPHRLLFRTWRKIEGEASEKISKSGVWSMAATASGFMAAWLGLSCYTDVGGEASVKCRDEGNSSKTPLDQRFTNLGHVLGEGAYGVVELAKDLESGKKVAIKTILCRDKQEMKAFEREISVLESIQEDGGHPNLLELIDMYINEETVQLVTELCPGGELFDCLIENGAFSEAEASRLILDLARGLFHLHNTCGWVHGDLKPENVLLRSKGNSNAISPVLVDFGSAHPIDQRPFSTQFGTPEYWAPENFDANARAKSFKGGRETDMFALGILTYILLYGAHPFDPQGRLSTRDLCLKIQKCDYDFNPAVLISQEAKDLIARLLARNPEARMTIRELLEHPWIRNNSNRNSAIQGAAERLEAYQLRREKMRAALVGALVQNSPADESSATKNFHPGEVALNFFDKSGQGYITAEDLHQRTGVETPVAAEMIKSTEGPSLAFRDICSFLSEIKHIKYPAGTVILEEGSHDTEADTARVGQGCQFGGSGREILWDKG